MATAVGPIASILASVFGGLQSRGAINDAVSALLNSFNQAGTRISDTVNAVNPNIYANADIWGNKMIDSGNAAADAATAAGERGIAGVNTAVTGGQGMMQPYQTAGTGAVQTLSDVLQHPQQFQFQADPGYQFRLNEGMKAIQRNAAAHGAAGGAGTGKALAQFGSGLASQEYQNAWNRWNTQGQQRLAGLERLAGMGQRAGEFSGDLGLRGATTAAGIGTNAAQYSGNARMNTTGAASNLWSHSTDEMSRNTLDMGNFLANMILQGGQARAGGDMARAGVWNQMLSGAASGVGQLGNVNWGNIFGGHPSGSPTYKPSGQFPNPWNP